MPATGDSSLIVGLRSSVRGLRPLVVGGRAVGEAEPGR